MRSILSTSIRLIFFLLTSLDAFAQAGTPPVYLKFNEDKVYVLNNEKVEFTADVFIGLPNLPIENLYAVGLEIVFPADLILPDSTHFTYYQESFLGQSGEIAISQKPQTLDKGHFNIAISRTNGKNINGFGKIGTVHFITVSDIIGSRILSDEAPFTASIRYAKLTNANGNDLAFDLSEGSDSVILVKDILARNQLNSLIREAIVYPNPASNQINISLRQMQGEYLELFNASGQRVYTESIRRDADNVQLSTAHYNPGIYLIKIHTKEGIVTKRVLIGR